MLSLSHVRFAGTLALGAACGLAQATLSFGWSLDNWQPVVAPDQTVQLHAHINNSALSTESLLGSRLVEAFGEGIEDAYDFADALPSLAEQLKNLVLAPGEEAEFIFGRLLPQGGHVEPGRYSGGGFAMSFADSTGRVVEWGPDRSLVVTVQDTGGGGSVPEPAPAALLASALALLALRRRA